MNEIIENFRKRNMNCYFATDKKEALALIFKLLPPKATIGFGGSVTLEEIGILELLRKNENYTLYDRTREKNLENLEKLYRKMFSADVFLTSSNAITEKGQIVNVDGKGNRVAMITFGPKKVIIVVGKNKITKDSLSGIERVKKVATPLNVKRLIKASKEKSEDNALDITEEKIWGQVSVIERQLEKDRIHVVIVGEKLGF